MRVRLLGMAVNAEGVETSEQLAALRAEGCAEIQGYLFSKPIPLADIAELLQRLGNSTLSAVGQLPWDPLQAREPDATVNLAGHLPEEAADVAEPAAFMAAVVAAGFGRGAPAAVADAIALG